MLVAYIAGPYRSTTERGLVENIRHAEKYMIRFSKLGYSVICPHTNTAHMGGVMPDQFWLDSTMELLRRSDVVVMIPGWERSVGAKAELEEAKRLGKHVIIVNISNDEFTPASVVDLNRAETRSDIVSG